MQGYAKQAIGHSVFPQPACDMQSADLGADKSKTTRAQSKAAKAARRHAKQVAAEQTAADQGVGLHLQHEIAQSVSRHLWQVLLHIAVYPIAKADVH